MATRRAAGAADEMKTLLVEQANGEKFKVTVPKRSKVTFGQFNPGSQGRGGYGGDNRTALRIYESAQVQLACFTGVKTFRDLSLKVERQVIQESGEAAWSDDTEGNTVRVERRQQKKSWREEDEEDD